MTAEIPVKVVVDCSAQAGLAATVPDILAQASATALAGDAEKTAQLLDLAKERAAAAASEPAAVTIVPLNAAELAQRDLDNAAATAATEVKAQRAWIEMRMKRDRWLAQTDAFFVNPLPSDFPADKAKAIAANLDAWRAFRQQLRDLPANTTDPTDPAWPDAPDAPQVLLS